MTGSLSTTVTNSQDVIKHDVFLSFRGEDTRRKFTGHLHRALTLKGIDAYIDTRLDGGERIETLFRKITECLVTVVIFSPKYADSGWCMGELVMIVECMERKGMRVLPVFVGVEPTHVREQSGEFGEGFKRGLDKCKDEEESWRSALVKIANIRRSEWDPDWISEEQILGETLCSFHRSEDQIVGDVVSAIEKILDQMSANDLEDGGFIGSERILKVESLLRIDSKEGVHLVGISGTSGIGKTTIARTVFNRNSGDFDAVCFLENIAEKSHREGLDSLQKDMITQLLGQENSRAGLHILSANIKRKLKRKRVLIILDDVGTARQLHTLFGNPDIYGPGSRLIVTSKEIQVLKSSRCIDVYEVEKLNNREASQLFKYHAFKQKQPTGEFIELSKKIVAYSKGLPSVLENLGCNLLGKSIKEWKSELAKLQETLGLETTTADEVEEMES